jgi:drug/metabolite transporter (DMT)-like permease
VTAIALALAASLSWGVGDFLGGVSSRRLRTLTVLAVSEVAGLILIAAYVAAARDPFPGATATAAALGAGAAGAVGLGTLYRGMAVGAIGVVAPISAGAAALPVAVGLARGERPAAIQLAGIVLVLVGVVLVSREPGPAGSRLAAGVGLAVVAALGFGLYFLLIDAASEDGAAWAVCLARGTATVGAGAVALALGALRDVRARDLPLLAVIGVFDVGANALLAVALNEGLVSLVAVLASLYPVVTVVLARVVLSERVARPQAVGIGGALGGVALISAG